MEVRVIAACCDPLLSEPLAVEEAEELAAGFKVLADPVRLRLLSLVANTPDGELCACEVVGTVDRSQPTVSHHLSILADAGLLIREQRGRWAYFRVDRERVGVLRDALTID